MDGIQHMGGLGRCWWEENNVKKKKREGGGGSGMRALTSRDLETLNVLIKQTPRIGKNLSTEGQFNTRIARTRVRARLEVLRLGLTILERR